MANINWDVVFHVDPATLRPAPSGVPVPTYGRYGGPDFWDGTFGPPAEPYAEPVDDLDGLFLVHDVESAAAITPGQQALADLGLLRGVVALTPADLDAEASVYAGLTTLAMVGNLAAEGSLDLLSETELLRAVLDAARDIGRGLDGLDAGERDQAEDWLRDVADAVIDRGGILDAAGIDVPGFVLQVAVGDWLA
jgi:hypothetical protein